MENSLAGKIAIISGSDSGIGAQIARELSDFGATVIINYPFAEQVLIDRAAAVVASLKSPGIAVQADMSTTTGPQMLVDATVAAYGRIDILVNNAGIAVNLPFEEQSLEHWDSLVNINGRGTFLLTQAALPHLAPKSRIVNICSISAREAPALQTIYAGTKGMVDAFTRVWAKELPARYGCTVNAASPGPTATEGFGAAGQEFMQLMQPVMDKTPVGPRLGETNEVAYAVLMLCLPRASWINGVNVHVCGGLFMQ
ncbi:putative oxidoreductase [Lachnellula subtilissima]|uniref:Putative oxidoreductase n=1 Tax=Lachnellula subtilissima TaxID=602034 RepID=A0A8H8U9B2_9HELO|nr:putative oxidoreductase [Lachnellula subtilissima]